VPAGQVSLSKHRAARFTATGYALQLPRPATPAIQATARRADMAAIGGFLHQQTFNYQFLANNLLE